LTLVSSGCYNVGGNSGIPPILFTLNLVAGT
jgi:hypothetical protein